MLQSMTTYCNPLCQQSCHRSAWIAIAIEPILWSRHCNNVIAINNVEGFVVIEKKKLLKKKRKYVRWTISIKNINVVYIWYVELYFLMSKTYKNTIKQIKWYVICRAHYDTFCKIKLKQLYKYVRTTTKSILL